MSCKCWCGSDMEYKNKIKNLCDQLAFNFKSCKDMGSDIKIEDIQEYILSQIRKYYDPLGRPLREQGFKCP